MLIIIKNPLSDGNAPGLSLLCCLYGLCLGGTLYLFRVHIFERVRSRDFPQAMAIFQACQVSQLHKVNRYCSCIKIIIFSWQALPVAIGIGLSGYVSSLVDNRVGLCMSGGFLLLGWAILATFNACCGARWGITTSLQKLFCKMNSHCSFDH